MSVTYQSAGTIAYSTGNPAVGYPASLSIGDLILLVVGTKPSTASVTRPVGDFAFLGSYAGGGGTTAADAGPTRLDVFWKIATGNESGTQTVTVPGNSVSWAQMYRYSNSTSFWDLAIAGGTDSTTGSAWSVTCDANPGIVAGDELLIASCTPTDIGAGAQFTSESVSATGATLGSMTEISEPFSSSGNDIGGFVFKMSCTAGPATAAPIITATASGTTTNIRGPSALIRIREASFQQEIDKFTLDADGATLTLTDEVTDSGGGNGTGTWVYKNAFAENAMLLGSFINCTTSSTFTRIINLPKDLTDCWFTIRLKFETALPTNNIAILQAKTTGAVVRAELQYRDTGEFQMRNATTLVGSGIGSITLGETYFLSWHLSNGVGQSLYLYDEYGSLIDSETATFNQGSFNYFNFGLLNVPGVALDLNISRPGYNTSEEIPPTITSPAGLGVFGIPMS